MRLLTCCLIAAIPLAGCNFGPAPPKRGKLDGNVTLNGAPIAAGKIWFFALDESGVNVLAPIKDGHYSLPEGQGPTKGKYRIQFSVPSDKKNRFPNPDFPGQWIEEPFELLPPRYYRDSQIIEDYDPAIEKSYDFQLTMP
jgi:hypothetical protein